MTIDFNAQEQFVIEYKIPIEDMLTKYNAQAQLDHDLTFDVVWSIVAVESNFNTHAYRYEPGFYTRYILPLLHREKLPIPREVTGATEAKGRATSWGFMQVLGQVARERGFRGPYLTELTTPMVGIEFGIKHFLHLLKRFDDSDTAIQDTISAYNQGGAYKKRGKKEYKNQGYVDKVLEKVEAYPNTFTALKQKGAFTV